MAVCICFSCQRRQNQNGKTFCMANGKTFSQMKIAIVCHINFCQSRKRPLSSNSFFLFHYRTNFLNFILQICTFHGIGNYNKAFSCVIFVNRKKWNLKFVQLELNTSNHIYLVTYSCLSVDTSFIFTKKSNVEK